MVMAAETKVSRTADFAARIVAAVPALMLLSASARGSATAIAAKCSAISAVAAHVLLSSAALDAVARLLPVAGRGLELCMLGDLVHALDLLQFSGAIWHVLQFAGRIAGETLVTQLIWSVIGMLS
jgi:hypothetical protein